MGRRDFGVKQQDEIKRDPLIKGFHLGTRIIDTFDCAWVATYDLWSNCIQKHTAKRDSGTEYIATFETLEDWEKEFKTDGIKKKPVFCMLMEPYNRWLEGLRYWLTDWQLGNKDHNLWDIDRDSPLYFEKFGWPRMSNQTKTITECIIGIEIDEFLVIDQQANLKFADLIKKYKLSYPLDVKLTASHQAVYSQVFMKKYREEVNRYSQWMNENLKFRDKVIQNYLKDDYNLWWKYKQF
mgnify:CR=1 FL=1|jgi:hypothetical protein|tara:strand:+ start:2554 stop:3267 length:714 start_codon:yes stop_codon:yes gene_type:complete